MAPKPTDPTQIEALQRQIAELQAQLAAAQQANVTGSGAAAQSGGTALCEGSVQVAGDNTAPVNTGKAITTQGGASIEGQVAVRYGHFIGRDFIQNVTRVVQSGEDPEEAKSVIALYLYALAADLAGLRLAEIDVVAQITNRSPLQLADVYVALDTTLSIPVDATLAEWLRRDHARLGDEPRESRETRPVTALEALAAHRELTLLGKPGSGKSTFGASILLALTATWQGRGEGLGGLFNTWPHGALLPIRVVLRRFAAQLPSGERPVRAGDLWDFIVRDLAESGYGLSTRSAEYVWRIARNTGALFLLDGLDECGDKGTRARVLDAVKELMRTLGPKCRFLMTARPYAWPDGADPNRGVYMLADFDDEQIDRFIHLWYEALGRNHWLAPSVVERKMVDLSAAVRRPDLLPMSRNPMLLTVMATLHAARTRLPDDRAEIYDDAVDLLMLRWNRQIGADKGLMENLNVPGLRFGDLRDVIEQVAFRVHEQNAGQEGTSDISESRLVRLFRPLVGNSTDKAELIITYLEQRAGILICHGEKDGERQFAFPHRMFQEFLAACHLATLDNFAAECVHLAWTAPEYWENTLSLAARMAKTERGASAVDELVRGLSIAEFRSQRQPDAADWISARMAGLMIQEIGPGAMNKRDRTRAISMRVAGWLSASLSVLPAEGGLTSALRAQAGDVLSAIGDLRFDPQQFYLPADEDLGFVHVASDPAFRIGTRPKDALRVSNVIGYRVRDDEINDAITPTGEFYIARYPVTVAQFRTFLDVAGQKIGDVNALSDPDNRPVRWVSWYEAVAYCDWLNETLRTSSALAACEVGKLVRSGKWQIALSSELEWEKAARGGIEGAIFHWGDAPDPERANYADSNIGNTSAVGCFPANAYGMHDAIGNLWEWTRSLWGQVGKLEFPYPYESDSAQRENLSAENNVYRVVRGGSWFNGMDRARCAFRFRFLPADRDNVLGFRVVLRPPPVS